MTRLRARAVGGRRIQEATPGGHWKIMTILGAMSQNGIIAAMTIEEPTDGPIFLGYIEQVLCPALKPGDVVAMDNLSSHKVAGVRELIEAAGAEVLYLPPYSPELNPVENIWQFLRQNFLSNRVFVTYRDIVDACCDAWNALMAMPDRIRSIASRDYAKAVNS